MLLNSTNKKYKLVLMLIILLMILYSCSPRLCAAYTKHGPMNHKQPKALIK
jgi:hypothetical protein